MCLGFEASGAKLRASPPSGPTGSHGAEAAYTGRELIEKTNENRKQKNRLRRINLAILCFASIQSLVSQPGVIAVHRTTARFRVLNEKADQSNWSASSGL